MMARYDDRAVVAVGDEGLDSVGLESLDESKGLFAGLVARADGDDVRVGLSRVAGSVLDCESVSDLQAGLKRVVAVDDCDGAGVAVGEDGGNGIGLNGSDIVAAVVNDVEVVDALLGARVIGELYEAFLLEEEKCAGLVGVVSGDDDGCAGLKLGEIAHAVAVDAERLIVDLCSGDEVSAVGSVEAVEVGGVLEVVCVKLAVCKSGVGQDVIIVNNDLKVVALGSKNVLDGLKDLGVGGGACADDQRGQGSGSFGRVCGSLGCGRLRGGGGACAATASGENAECEYECEDDGKSLLHFVFLLFRKYFGQVHYIKMMDYLLILLSVLTAIYRPSS